MNISIEIAAPSDIAQLVAVWNMSFGTSWPLTEQLLHQSFNSDFHEREGVLVARDNEYSNREIIGWVWARSNRKVSDELGRFAGRGGIGALCVLPEYQRRGVGTQLCAAAEDYLRTHTSPLTTLIYPAHLLPGVPHDCESALKFFKHRGYKVTDTHHDLRRNLNEYSIPEKALAALRDNRTVEIRRAHEGETKQVQEFVTREFPGGWAYSTKRHFTHGGTTSDFVVAVEENKIIGFCHTADFRSPHLLPSTYWHEALGAKYGGLGPIGMAKTHRKRGLGLALCAQAVQILKDAGVEEMAIDWTTLVGFYGQMGFEVWKSYAQMEK